MRRASAKAQGLTSRAHLSLICLDTATINTTSTFPSNPSLRRGGSTTSPTSTTPVPTPSPPTSSPSTPSASLGYTLPIRRSRRSMHRQSHVRLDRALRNVLVRSVRSWRLHLRRLRKARNPRALLSSHHPRLARQDRLQVRVVIRRERLLLLLRSDPFRSIAVLHRAVVRVAMTVRAVALLCVRVLHDRYGVLARYRRSIVLHRHSGLRAEFGLERRVVVDRWWSLLLADGELGKSEIEARRKRHCRSAVLGASARQLTINGQTM